MTEADHQSATTVHPLMVVADIYNRLERGTRADRVYVALRRAILQGDLEPRTRITEVDLASKIEASRTPVREALRRLRDEELIILGSTRVLEVKEMDLPEALETYQILEVLEPLAARLAAQNISEETIIQLKKSVDLTEFFFEKERWDDVTTLRGNRSGFTR